MKVSTVREAAAPKVVVGGVLSYKERCSPLSLIYSSLRLKHHLPSLGLALPNV